MWPQKKKATRRGNRVATTQTGTGESMPLRQGAAPVVVSGESLLTYYPTFVVWSDYTRCPTKLMYLFQFKK